MFNRDIRFRDLLFVLIVIFLVFLSVLSYKRIESLNKSSVWVNHSNEVKSWLNKAFSDITDSETRQRGYLLTKDSTFLEPFHQKQTKIEYSMWVLDSLTRDNSQQHQYINELDSLVNKRFLFLEELTNINDKEKLTSLRLIPFLYKSRLLMDEIRSCIAKIEENEELLLHSRTTEQERLSAITPSYTLVFSLLAIALVIVTYARLRKETSLRFIAQNSEAKIRLAQKQLVESETKFRLLSDTLPQLIWTADAQGNFTYFNKTFLEFSGMSQNNSGADRGWINMVHENDKQISHDNWMQSVTTGSDFFMEHRFKNAAGEYHWQLSRAIAQKTDDGFITMWVGSSTDIQDQKNRSAELEQKVTERTAELKNLNDTLAMQNTIFNHAEENALMGSYAWDMQSGNIKYSDNLFRIFGHQPGDFIPSFEKFVSFIHPGDKEQVIADGKETYEKRQLSQHVYRVITKQGQLKYCRSTGNFQGEAGHQILVGSVQDITNDILLNEQLQEKNSELERSNAELASFNYIASHDLQEPLRKIQTFSNYILEKDEASLTTSSKQSFERITNAAQRMQNLINALINYSRANASDITFEEVDLNMVMKDTLDNLSETIKEKNAAITFENLPVVKAIPVQIGQVFLNLVSNAVKYSKKDVVPVITVTASMIQNNELPADFNPSSEAYWKITFTDNGIGFEQQHANKVFELFQRLHGKLEYSGTGIGLAICKKIMLNHKGAISAAAEPGKGASFSIFFPA